MRRFCYPPLCVVGRKDRFNSSPRYVTINGRKVMVSAKSALQSDGLIGAVEIADRIWERHQELALNGPRTNPFVAMGLTEPHLRAALQAKGYL